MKILAGTLILRMLVQILNCRLLKELFNKNLQQFQQEPVAVSVPGNTSRSSPTSSSCDTHQSRTSSPTSDHSLTHQGSGISSCSSDSSSETPLEKFRSLREIYEKMYFALYVIEPSCFKKAVESQAWKNAMLKEMQAI